MSDVPTRPELAAAIERCNFLDIPPTNQDVTELSVEAIQDLWTLAAEYARCQPPAPADADELGLPGPTMGTPFPVTISKTITAETFPIEDDAPRPEPAATAPGDGVEEWKKYLTRLFRPMWDKVNEEDWDGMYAECEKLLAARAPVPDAVLAASGRLRRNVTETFEVDGHPYNSDPDVLLVADWIAAGRGSVPDAVRVDALAVIGAEKRCKNETPVCHCLECRAKNVARYILRPAACGEAK